MIRFMIGLVVFFISVFFIFYAMVGYPILLIILDKLIRPKSILMDKAYEPTVTYMIVAHNEEKVIQEKLENALVLDYPKEKLEILVASDNSTDMTNDLVRKFILQHQSYNIRLYITNEHKGKTNAQNEAQKTVKSEILVMTDANSILKPDAIRLLVSSFTKDNIAYVCGKLLYINENKAETADSEATYWNMDLKMRDIESRIYCITAGNGAIYACRNSLYHDFEPIQCHDSAMPAYYMTKGKLSLFNPNAVAYEKAGEVDRDEFKRKVRMNRELIKAYKTSFKFLDIFKYKWFSLFYFGHRTCRYFLWFFHLLAFFSAFFMLINGSLFGCLLFVLQVLAIFITIYQINIGFKGKLLRMLGYYGMTIASQYYAIWKSLNGQSKAIWSKAESTR